MDKLYISKRDASFDHLIKKTPASIVGKLIDKPTIIYEAGEPILGYFFMPDSLMKDVRRAAMSVKLSNDHRTWGLPTKSVVLGVMPRHSTMNNYCRFTSPTKKEISNFAILSTALEYAASLYERYFPEHYKAAKEEIASSVDKSWRYNDTPYLTINVNVNHAIKYHRDNGNFKSALSTVLIVKHNIRGGELCCPELGVTLSQRGSALTLFDGRSLVHGITPIAPTGPNAIRASIVFYSMSNLKHCYPYSKEFERVKIVSTEKARVAATTENRLLLAKICA
jgi:hypothetical protein